MKLLKLTFLMTIMSGAMVAQDIRFPGLDPSPADIAYLRPSRGAAPIAKIIYSRPQMKGRKVFTTDEVALVPFGTLWRTGANETTELHVYKDFKMGGKEVKAGTYSLYSIPAEKEWTIVLNGKLHTWGHFSYDESKDVVRFTAKSSTTENTVEAFTIKFEPPAEGNSKTSLYLAWENTVVNIPVEF